MQRHLVIIGSLALSVAAGGCQGVLGLSDGDYALADAGARVDGAPAASRDASRDAAFDGTVGASHDAADGADVDAKGDAASADGALDAGTDATAADAAPLGVRSRSLQLWLAADRALTCAGARVTTWGDLSGHRRNAEPGAALGPQCGARTLGGLPTVTFTAPGASAPYIDETLEVDLGFLLSSAYTIFIVERRALDRPVPDVGFLLGTQVANEDAIATHDCAGTAETALQLGYFTTTVNGTLETQLLLDHTCMGLAGNGHRPFADGGTVVAPIVVTARLDPTDNRYVYVNGEEKLAGAMPCTPGYYCATNALLHADNGSIGRGLVKQVQDSRYVGDIAEVIAYDASLDPLEQASIEAYLRRKWGF